MYTKMQLLVPPSASWNITSFLCRSSPCLLFLIAHELFSQRIISARRSEEENYDTFIKYTAVVWTLPAVFVAVCIALDKTEVFPINYGTICFLATEHSKIYLFILPIGLSLLFNLSIYIRTAIFLVKQQESTGELHQNRKQNLNKIVYADWFSLDFWILTCRFGKYRGI